MKWLATLAAGALCAALAAPTTVLAQNAQAYPTKPVSLVVPVRPGGILDAVARMIQQPMNQALGQPVIVDNKPGASGNIAATLVAKSPADGYNLLVGYSMFHVGNPSMFEKLAWDPIRDFQPVAMLVVAPHVVGVHPDQPIKTMKELVEYARANPNKMNYATSGNGSVPHVGMELFKQQNGLQIGHIPYNGAGPAMADVIAGRVELTIATPPSLMGYVQNGRLRALAVAAKNRHPLIPDVPTSEEAGFPGFELEAWVALFAPMGTPPDVVAKLSEAARQALQRPEVQEAARAAGMEIRHMGPQALDKQVREDLAYWSKVIKDANIRID